MLYSNAALTTAHSQEAVPMERNSADPGVQYQQLHFSLLTLPQFTAIELQGKSNATPALTPLVQERITTELSL